ncbi:MAG: hypothetical protein HFE73_07615 [Firmicutes bacterium]|nr:hypothetical protein [Bacillota bacterium]
MKENIKGTAATDAADTWNGQKSRRHIFNWTDRVVLIVDVLLLIYGLLLVKRFDEVVMCLGDEPFRWGVNPTWRYSDLLKLPYMILVGFLASMLTDGCYRYRKKADNGIGFKKEKLTTILVIHGILAAYGWYQVFRFRGRFLCTIGADAWLQQLPVSFWKTLAPICITSTLISIGALVGIFVVRQGGKM